MLSFLWKHWRAQNGEARLDTERRIERIQSGLLPPVLVKGESTQLTGLSARGADTQTYTRRSRKMTPSNQYREIT
jgi:hypothetical protein